MRAIFQKYFGGAAMLIASSDYLTGIGFKMSIYCYIYRRWFTTVHELPQPDEIIDVSAIAVNNG